MVLQEMMKQERREGLEEGISIGKIQGKAESVLNLLEESGPVSEMLRARILAETDLTVIRSWLRLASVCDSAEQFTQKAFQGQELTVQTTAERLPERI